MVRRGVYKEKDQVVEGLGERTGSWKVDKPDWLLLLKRLFIFLMGVGASFPPRSSFLLPVQEGWWEESEAEPSQSLSFE